MSNTRSGLAWDDFQIVLAIANNGSLSGASRALEVSHATIFRRLNEIERRIGVALFDRSRSGYSPTLAGGELASKARVMEQAALDAERRVAGRDLEPEGEVWITTTDSLLMGLLSPLFTEFRAKYPGIVLDVAISNQLFDLTRRDADAAIRPSNQPPENLIGRPLANIGQAIFGHKSLDVRPGTPIKALAKQPWILPGPRLQDRALQRWLGDNKIGMSCVQRVDTLVGKLSAVQSGMGVAVLPCYLAEKDPSLVQLTDPIQDLEYGLWFLMHPDLRGVVRIKALLEYLTEAIRAGKERVNGRPISQ